MMDRIDFTIDLDKRIKRCTKCSTIKSIHAFYRQPGGKYGVASICSECSSKRCKNFARSRYGRMYRLKEMYGLSIYEYDKLYISQNGRCAICTTFKEQLCVDHDHVTTKIRELLCRNCNTLIGQANDKTDVLLAAIKYLEKHQ